MAAARRLRGFEHGEVELSDSCGRAGAEICTPGEIDTEVMVAPESDISISPNTPKL